MPLFTLSLPSWLRPVLEQIATATEAEAAATLRIAVFLESNGGDAQVPDELADQLRAATDALRQSRERLQSAVDTNTSAAKET